MTNTLKNWLAELKKRLCWHNYELGMRNGTIHKVCYKCKDLIDTGV